MQSQIAVVRSLHELDMLVAEKVMGVINLDQWQINYRFDVSGHYSSCIKSAWAIVEKFDNQITPSTSILIETCSEGWYCRITEGCIVGQEVAKTTPIAVCLAALRVVGIEVELNLTND